MRSIYAQDLLEIVRMRDDKPHGALTETIIRVTEVRLKELALKLISRGVADMRGGC